MNNMAMRNYNSHFSKLREVHKNAGIYQLYSFCVEEQKGLAYRLEVLHAPPVVRKPQFGNH